MTELESAIVRATGESLRQIRRVGFSLLPIPAVHEHSRGSKRMRRPRRRDPRAQPGYFQIAYAQAA
jgi:hypothetical protein